MKHCTTNIIHGNKNQNVIWYSQYLLLLNFKLSFIEKKRVYKISICGESSNWPVNRSLGENNALMRVRLECESQHNEIRWDYFYINNKLTRRREESNTNILLYLEKPDTYIRLIDTFCRGKIPKKYIDFYN